MSLKMESKALYAHAANDPSVVVHIHYAVLFPFQVHSVAGTL